MKYFLNLLCFALILLFIGINSSQAQLTFNNGLTAQQLAQTLAGPGIMITNATFTCPTNGIGTFAGGGTTNIGIANGIILTTGPNSVALGPNNNASAGVCASGTFPGNPASGDPDLAPLAGAQTYDACKLEFDMVPFCDTLKFKYVFASEEYPEYVCSTYNDAFAFFISGPGITGQRNIALIPNTTIPVAINSVNSGTIGSSGTSGGCTSLGYSQYYVDNIGGSSIQYDGFTTVLTAKSAVQPCQTYHLKITIADAGDCIYDSGLLLQAGSLQCQPVKSITAVQNAIEGCQNGSFKFCRDDSTTALTFNYTIGGTATNGTDFTTISNSIIIPAGQSCFTLPIVALADGIAEGTETVKLIYQPGACPITDTATITISDGPPLNAGPNATICSGGSATIGMPPVAGTIYSWTPAAGLSNSAISNPSVTLTNVSTLPVLTNYVLSANHTGCIATDTVVVAVNPMPTVNAGPDLITCNSSWVQLNGSIGGGATGVTWSGGTGLFSPFNTILNNVYTPSTNELDAGSVTLILTTNDPAGPCPAAIDSITILFNAGSVVSASVDQLICAGNTIVLAGFVGGITTRGIWSGGAGTYNPSDTTLNAVYTPTTTEAAAGHVTLTLTSISPPGSCAEVSDQMVITINHLPTANAGSSQHVCSGSGIILSGAIGGAATGGTWSGGAGTYSPDNNTLNAIYTASAAEFAAGSVTLTLTTDDPAGPCTLSSSNVTFYFYINPVVDFTVDSAAGCTIHCTNFTNLSTIGGTDTIIAWSWDFGDNSPSSSAKNPSHCFSQTGYYDIKLSATSINGCTSSLTKIHFVHVFGNPVAEFDPTPKVATVIDPTINFSNQSSPDVTYWHWNFGDNTILAPSTSNPIHTYPDSVTGSYWVTLIVHNSNGCYDTVAHEVFIGPGFTFYIPNSFSPNNDGINDYFFGSGIGIIKYDLWIFDRWGNMIFHGNELNDKWNGRANGGVNEAQIDVFVWKVQLTDVNNKLHNYIGTVTLVK